MHGDKPLSTELPLRIAGFVHLFCSLYLFVTTGLQTEHSIVLYFHIGLETLFFVQYALVFQ